MAKEHVVHMTSASASTRTTVVHMTAPKGVARMVCPGPRPPPLESTRNAVMQESATLELANADALMASLDIIAAERLARTTAAATVIAKRLKPGDSRRLGIRR